MSAQNLIGFSSSNGASYRDSIVADKGSHYWLPNDILQDVKRSCVNSFSPVPDTQSQTY